MQEREGQQQPVVQSPERIAVARSNKIIGGFSHVSGYMHENEMDDNQKNEQDTGDAEEIPGKCFKPAARGLCAITSRNTHILSPLKRFIKGDHTSMEIALYLN